MGTGYIRADVGNNIENDEVADATYLDLEFDAIVAAFHASSGHTHDGTTAEGAPVTVLGPAQEYIGNATEFYPKTTEVYNLGTATFKWNNGTFSDTVDAGSFSAGGTNCFRATTTVGTAASGHFTWDGDTNTGITRTAADEIIIHTGGFERIQFDNSGIVTVAGEISAVGVSASTFVGTTFVGDLQGNADTATILETGRNFSITGGATAAAISFNGSGSVALSVTDLNATNLTAGTIPIARFPTSSTADDWVGARMAGITDADIGAIIFAKYSPAISGAIVYGDTTSAGNLVYASAAGTSGVSPAVGGTTYKCLGRINSTASTDAEKTTLWQRTV